MAQITSGFRSIFSQPAIYNLAQRLVGAEKARRMLVRDYIPRQPGLRVLDIGCGTAEILQHLPADTEYYGFDASEDYITQARRHFGSRGIFTAELVGQATVNDMPPFDIVLAFGLLHHLDDGDARTLFKLAKQALKKKGKLISIDPVYTTGQSQLARWLISKDRGQCVRTAEVYEKLATSQFDHVRATVRHDMLYMPYSHLILECKKQDARIL
ncbi:MAG: class I SAM-dependent methyltransferase [Mariprofundus sp.]|nr:class I SAM-dependent methyltransferase [Mariprofundus sp.]